MLLARLTLISSGPLHPNPAFPMFYLKLPHGHPRLTPKGTHFKTQFTDVALTLAA